MAADGPQPLTLRPDRGRSVAATAEREAVQLLHEVNRSHQPSPWDPSQLEDTYLRLREALIETRGVLPAFRHWFLAGGRLNFPDIPHPKTWYLCWKGGIPRGQKWGRGLKRLGWMIWRLSREYAFQWSELDDALIGEPSFYRIPSPNGWIAVTEAQVRYCYYRSRIERFAERPLGTVLEIGAGYGGLAAELLRRVPIRRYVIVELPDAIPLAYFHLRMSFDCPMQALSRPGEPVDPAARIVILPAWKLPELAPSVDLCLNTMSFHHMMPEALAYYLRQIDRLGAQQLYLVNRDVKRDSTDVIISKYPIPPSYALADRRPYPFEPHVEMVYRRTPVPSAQERGMESSSALVEAGAVHGNG